MKFKHAFNVLIDNFATTYKLLVYRLIVILITVGLSCAVIIPILNEILSTSQFEQMNQAFATMWEDIIALRLTGLADKLQSLMGAIDEFIALVSEKMNLVAIAVVCLIVVFFIHEFLNGIGNYVVGVLVNDKMTLHANSSFTMTLLKNLGNASLYSIIHAPLSVAFDIIGVVLVWAIVFVAFRFLNLLLVQLFLFVLLVILIYTVKATFTCDWLPALIKGKLKTGKAMAYTFDRRRKSTVSVFSNLLVISVIIIAINFAATFFTLGAGLLITLPASQIMLSAFSFVNYFDANKQKYFIDEYTIVGPKKEAPATREEFFKGDE